MTEQEQKAIKWMKNVRDDAVVTLDHIAKEEPNVSPMLYAGRKEKAETIIKGFEELKQYRAIGTPEECRALKDRLVSKKVSLRHVRKFVGFDDGKCPTCGESVSRDFDGVDVFCPECGQRLDWGDEE